MTSLDTPQPESSAGLTDGAEPPTTIPARTRVILGVLLLLTLLPFGPTLLDFHAVWTSRVYSHGYLILGVVVWLIWKDRRAILENAQPSGGIGLVALPALAGLWLAATVMNVQLFYLAAIPLILLSWSLSVFGLGTLRLLAPIAAIFFLAVPLWEILIPPLQFLTVVVSGVALRILDIPAEIQRTFITIPAGTFRIADTCAGIRQFMVALVLASIFAQLFIRTRRNRLKVLALGVAFGMVANWVRVISIIVVGQVTQMQSGLIEDHITFGWAIFSVGLVPFFLLAGTIEKRERQRESTEKASSDGGGGQLESSPGPPLPEYTTRLRKRALFASALAVSGPLLLFGMNSLPRASSDEFRGPEDGPGTDWAGPVDSSQRPYTWEPLYQGADEHRTAVFTNGSATVFLDRLLYRNQAQGAELIYYQNRIAPDSVLVGERLLGPLGRSGLWVRQALVDSPEGRLMVAYWFRVGGVDTAFPPWAKVLELFAFFRRTPASELVALSVRCGPEDCTAATESLFDLLGEL